MSLSVAGAIAGGPAGLAVGAVVDMVKSAIGDILGTLQRGFSQMKSLVEETVGAFRPIEIELMNRAMKDLQATVGTILLPVMQEMTRIVRELSVYIYSLPDSFKDLIRNFAEIALVAGVVATIVGAIATALGAFLLLNPAIDIIIGLTAVIGALTYVFSQTEGGARFFSNALKYVEQVFAGVQAMIEYVWQQVQPVYQELRKAFSELGDALSELLEALKPLVAGELAIIGTIIKNWLTNFISNLTDMVNGLKVVVRWVSELLAPLKAFGFSLPSVDRERKDPRGLGVHGGNVTDLLGSFRQIQESILNFASDADQKKNDAEQREAIKQTAANTAKTNAILIGLLNGMGLGAFAPAPDFRAGRA